MQGRWEILCCEFKWHQCGVWDATDQPGLAGVVSEGWGVFLTHLLLEIADIHPPFPQLVLKEPEVQRRWSLLLLLLFLKHKLFPSGRQKDEDHWSPPATGTQPASQMPGSWREAQLRLTTNSTPQLSNRALPSISCHVTLRGT